MQSLFLRGQDATNGHCWKIIFHQWDKRFQRVGQSESKLLFFFSEKAATERWLIENIFRGIQTELEHEIFSWNILIKTRSTIFFRNARYAPSRNTLKLLQFLQTLNLYIVQTKPSLSNLEGRNYVCLWVIEIYLLLFEF